jgi:hypothetical protein
LTRINVIQYYPLKIDKKIGQGYGWNSAPDITGETLHYKAQFIDLNRDVLTNNSTGFVANRPEINAIQLGIFPDSLAAVVSAITAAVPVGLKQRRLAFAPEGYRPVTVSGPGS